MSTLTIQLDSQNHWIADGSQTVWDFNFSGGYINKAHVRAYMESADAVPVRTDISIDYEHDFVGPYQLLIEPAVPAFSKLVIYRATPKDLPLVDFQDGGGITEQNLDIAHQQAVFLAQESADYLGVTTTADLLDLAQDSLANAGAAAASATNAATAWVGAQASASAANVSALAAAGSATASNNSAANAAAAATAAANSAVGTFQTALANYSAANAGAGLVGFSYAPNYVIGTLGGVAKTLGIDITQRPYLADKTGATSIVAAFNAAVAAFPGVPLRLPAGTYLVDGTGLQHVITTSGAFGPFGSGLQIYGDGPFLTRLDNRVVGGACITLGTTVLNTFQHSAKLHGISIFAGAATANSTGLSIRSCYNMHIQDVWINGMSADGIKVIVSNGDQDASNMLKLKHVRLDTCAGWGFNTQVTGAHNEFSFLSFDHVFVNGCGTASVSSTPPSGGMRWKGQIMDIRNSAFVLNQNVGLYVEGGGGVANTVSISNTAFENNVRRHVFVTGCDGFAASACQMYSNNSYIVHTGMEFDATSYIVRGVTVDGMLVRAGSANNAYTAFKQGGANLISDTCRIRNVRWGDFDYAGQTRFSGVQFDPIPKQCVLVALSTTLVGVRPELGGPIAGGNKMPLRLRGGAGGVPSTSGEWVATQIGNAGVTASNSGLAASTVYYVYLYDNGGAPGLELSTTADAVDSSTGYSIKTGDATRLYVGRVATDGATNFLLAGTGWLNPEPISGSQVGIKNWLWASGSGKLYVKFGNVKPSSDTDGTVVGTQT
jgi:hypothetical protein